MGLFMTKKQRYAVDNRCGGGKRGCRVVALPFGDVGFAPFWATQFSVIGFHQFSAGRQPYWKVVRWDSDTDARELSEAAG
jgi:hypothetical protein